MAQSGNAWHLFLKMALRDERAKGDDLEMIERILFLMQLEGMEPTRPQLTLIRGGIVALTASLEDGA